MVTSVRLTRPLRLSHRKRVWKPPQLPWSAGLSGEHEQEHAGQISSAHDHDHEQPQARPARPHPSRLKEHHALHREFTQPLPHIQSHRWMASSAAVRLRFKPR